MLEGPRGRQEGPEESQGPRGRQGGKLEEPEAGQVRDRSGAKDKPGAPEASQGPLEAVREPRDRLGVRRARLEGP